jgi:Dolichyl-phosphate-mannose-protein mannosyltransferase
VHPPFAKLLFAFVGWLVGFDGQFEFENIGDDYVANNVPYVALRSLPALLGSLAPAVVYAIMKESGYPRLVGLLSACLVIFGVFIASEALSWSVFLTNTSPNRQRPHCSDSTHPPRRRPRLICCALAILLHPLLQVAL